MKYPDLEKTLTDRVTCAGKFFALGGEKWKLRGFSYGPFPPRADGQFLPELSQLRCDLSHMRELNANCIRVYHPPAQQLLDEALKQNIRVFIDVPWEKHRCFFEDWTGRQDALVTAKRLAAQLGNHPGLFAISVGNEIPADIVRFYGRERVANFVTEMLDVVKQVAPDCLTTYVSYPTTEFLDIEACDFCTLNVYLDDERKLGAYADRLQHIAGNRPLLLGEYGSDTLRSGQQQQADRLTAMIRRSQAHGLAGEFIFSYTDEWFTGGKLIEDWQFGVTHDDRGEKLAAQQVRQAWEEPTVYNSDLPGVSVVVCSYNGGNTLRECLESLSELDYHDYEVILVDDGSTDCTREIAADFPQVVYHFQENKGLSVARNVGAELASKEVVAYTDSDCVADRDWLAYLMTSMKEQQVQAIGGPNITPPSDGWVAKCVSASPGNPSHVMLDDQHAEHVPGCNMAFHRDVLLNMGGFDPQFRQAGDDVDICWRILDSGMHIGYAPGAMVWHKRRATVKAYCKQQSGYGRSEALVVFKYPQRCDLMGQAIWRGIIYGDGAVGLPLSPEVIYHGRFGSGLFQIAYRHNQYAIWSITQSLAWHIVAVFVLLLSTMIPRLAYVTLAMEVITLLVCARSAMRAPLPSGAPWWSRPLTMYLYWVQPLLRGWHRTTHLILNCRMPRRARITSRRVASRVSECAVRKSSSSLDLHWDNHESKGREELLHSLVPLAKRRGWNGDYDNAWADWDVNILGDFWHEVTIHTATEELGWPRRFTRARCTAKPTSASKLLGAALAVWLLVASLSWQPWALAIGTGTAIGYWFVRRRSSKHCLDQVADLLNAAARAAGLEGSRTRESSDGIKIETNHRAPTSEPTRTEAVAAV